MQSEIVKESKGSVSTGNGGPLLPAIIAQAGDHAARRFIEFFTATIRNANTRRAYAKAVRDFLAWCEGHNLTLPGIEPVHVAAYIEQLTRSKAAPTVKQHLAAIGMLFDWLTSGGIASEKKSPLFRSIDRHRTMTGRPLDARNALDMIKRRAKAIGLPETICCHTFRATGITAYLENGGTIEHAQQIANHESPKTTKLYDRTSDQITLDEVERIII